MDLSSSFTKGKRDNRLGHALLSTPRVHIYPIISLIGPYHKSENQCKDTCPESGQEKQIEVNAISSHSLMCT